MIVMIAAIGKKREIGRGGGLVFHLKEDMKFFREKTMGHKVVMGRKTWESLPKKLPGRENIVVSRGEVKGVDKVVHHLTEFLQENTETEEEVFVIGGGAVYEAALPYARKMYLTEVKAEAPGADVVFPEFDKRLYAREVLQRGEENGVEFEIVCYTRSNKEEK